MGTEREIKTETKCTGKQGVVYSFSGKITSGNTMRTMLFTSSRWPKSPALWLCCSPAEISPKTFRSNQKIIPTCSAPLSEKFLPNSQNSCTAFSHSTSFFNHWCLLFFLNVTILFPPLGFCTSCGCVCSQCFPPHSTLIHIMSSQGQNLLSFSSFTFCLDVSDVSETCDNIGLKEPSSQLLQQLPVLVLFISLSLSEKILFLYL